MSQSNTLPSSLYAKSVAILVGAESVGTIGVYEDLGSREAVSRAIGADIEEIRGGNGIPEGVLRYTVVAKQDDGGWASASLPGHESSEFESLGVALNAVRSLEATEVSSLYMTFASAALPEVIRQTCSAVKQNESLDMDEALIARKTYRIAEMMVRMRSVSAIGTKVADWREASGKLQASAMPKQTV